MKIICCLTLSFVFASLAGLRIGVKESSFQASQAPSIPGRPGPPRTELEQHYASLLRDLQNRNKFARRADQTFRSAALIDDADRDPTDVVLRRTAALLSDLQKMIPPQNFDSFEDRLDKLCSSANGTPVVDTKARYAIYERACALRRKIAFSNPLLDFDKILFIKRHRALFNHMCDQYYGMAAKPGGGLYVLNDPFGDDPQVRDLLADQIVQNGRLKGSRLFGGPAKGPRLSFDGMGNRKGQETTTGGTFLSPDLSFDGKSILFAYVENQGDMQHQHHTDPSRGHWDPGRAYHIFRVDTDGANLKQLTDGSWNDFDPCWLPNGRIAFISERRGGYLRCGRVCPTYTLFDMAADGNDITCLSYHETNEWQPSVTNDGNIIWTRWDYVDRHGCTAHQPWITTLDGRNPRAVHGNFAPRKSRPDMELDVRAIPQSHKFVATAAPHHGQSYGSLVIIDPGVPDDDKMAPVKRITPEVGFPETQGGGQVYGTPWPLSEDYYLCVYDASMSAAAGRQGGSFVPGNYGIYLIDSFGNRELIYRDPEIASLSPIPLRSRTKPPAARALAKAGQSPTTVDYATDQPGEATLSVLNVYDSLKSWPDDTKITALRVLQVLPMTTPSGTHSHETGLRLPSAGDSVVPARHVLGTVPVEEDGSAHFTVPAEREIFFQALDEQGMAVQSMRSATYLHKGESLTCHGCHEPQPRAPKLNASIPKALRRSPSKLKPDVDGSHPFSYPRLVQPVLDRKCVDCHAKQPDLAPDLSQKIVKMPRGRGKVYASYASLAPQFGFWNYGESHRTTPGEFGARASKLLELLEAGHYDVKLSSGELHRITLWLDCVSLFYGVYEKEGGEAQLRGEVVWPTLK